MKRYLAGHLAVWVVVAAVARIGLVPAEICPAVTPERLMDAIHAGGSWLAAGQGTDGRYLYGYDERRDEVSGDYNIVRHAGVVMSLYQVAAVTSNEFFDTAETGLAYMLDRLVEHDDWVALAEPGSNLSLGSTSLFIAGLAARRDLTGDTSYDDLMRRLARFVVAQQQEDGSVLAFWDRSTEAPRPGVYGPFATGEAFWALALLDRHFPGEGWDRPAHRVANYLAERRDEVEGNRTRQPDHWGAYGLAELAEIDPTEAAWARRLGGYFGLMVRIESQKRGEGLNFLVRGWEASGAGIGVVGEATGALWRLTGKDQRLAGQRADLAERTLCVAGMLVERQRTAEDAADSARPQNVEGAWFYRGYTQMDHQQHALSALGAALAIVEER